MFKIHSTYVTYNLVYQFISTFVISPLCQTANLNIMIMQIANIMDMKTKRNETKRNETNKQTNKQTKQNKTKQNETREIIFLLSRLDHRGNQAKMIVILERKIIIAQSKKRRKKCVVILVNNGENINYLQ